ncbi:MAG: heme A synthase [Gemmatimonadetes bacterium]|nr:heme A synthase [Gemmatimonadota bacterium]
MSSVLHPRAFRASVYWTLGLLFLGSVVHATGSSLACPDWPTCYGTMVPEMTGGIFWEHLHRLVAGGLLLLWGLATWLARKESADRPWVFKAAVAGVVLLLVQSVFGGLTVLYQLPDLVSSTHLALAFSFLALATVMATATAEAPPAPRTADGEGTGLRTWAVVAAAMVFVQSVLGALVRHMDAGVACMDFPLCLGRVVPPLVNAPITVHFLHRALAVVTTAVVLALWVRAHRTETSPRIRTWATVAAALVLTQVGLGVASVITVLAVAPVSLHTLVAASLLAALVHIATAIHPARRVSPAAVPAGVA